MLPEKLINIIKKALDENDIDWDGIDDNIWIDDENGKTYSINVTECFDYEN